MISASHNPWRDNGIKVFGPDGYKLPDEVELEIETEIFALLKAMTPRKARTAMQGLLCPAISTAHGLPELAGAIHCRR